MRTVADLLTHFRPHGLCLGSTLVGGCLLRRIPVEITPFVSLGRLDLEHQNQGAAWNIRRVWPGIVQNAVMVDRRATSRYRASHRGRGIELVHF